jgi:hypothetical protein
MSLEPLPRGCCGEGRHGERRCPRLYTLSTAEGPLGLLARLPHQRAVADSRSSAASRAILASLRTEIERRHQAGQGSGGGEPELVLVIDELSSLSGEPDPAYLLTHGRECGLRVLAATADAAVERGPLVESFETRIVFGLADEEASTRLLGNDGAETLLGPGHLFARLGRRKEVEVLGLHLTEAGRRELFAAMGVDDTPSRPALELVADGAVGGATGSLTGSGPKDGEHEGSLPGERESVEILDPQLLLRTRRDLTSTLIRCRPARIHGRTGRQPWRAHRRLRRQQ